MPAIAAADNHFILRFFRHRSNFMRSGFSALGNRMCPGFSPLRHGMRSGFGSLGNLMCHMLGPLRGVMRDFVGFSPQILFGLGEWIEDKEKTNDCHDFFHNVDVLIER